MRIRNEICHICGDKTVNIFKGIVRGKYKVAYFHCTHCGFLQTEKPYWLKEAYTESINISDTGLVRRNIWLSSVTAIVSSLLLSKNMKGLDYGGGYGLFVRLMRDKGFDFAWDDPWTENLFARGFEYVSGEQVDLVTCFEAFEHFENPRKEIESILKRGNNILFTTQLLPEPIPHPENWWYYDLENGQHVSFYAKKTLNYLAKHYDLHLASARSVHMLSRKKIPNVLFRMIVIAGRIGIDKVLLPGRKNLAVEDMKKVKTKR